MLVKEELSSMYQRHVPVVQLRALRGACLTPLEKRLGSTNTRGSTEDSQADSGKLKGFCPFRMKSTLYLTINLPFETSGVLIL